MSRIRRVRVLVWAIIACVAVIAILIGNYSWRALTIQRLNSDLYDSVLREDVAEAALVIAHGADINHLFQWNETCLHVAARTGNSELVDLLINAGSRIDVADHRGQTPLIYAVRNGRTDIVKRLILAGASVTFTDSVGKSSLDWARDLEHDAIEDTLRVSLRGDERK